MILEATIPHRHTDCLGDFICLSAIGCLERRTKALQAAWGGPATSYNTEADSVEAERTALVLMIGAQTPRV